MTAATLVRETILLAGLNDAALESIVQASTERRLRRGDVLFAEGESPDALYIVESGRIAIANRNFLGRESVVALMETGDLFGEMGLFDGHGRSAEARAREACVVSEIPYEPVQQLYEADTALLWQAINMLTNRLRNTDRALAD